MTEIKVKIMLSTSRRIHFEVDSKSGQTRTVVYDITKDQWSCDCEGNSLWGMTCYHIKNAKKTTEEKK
jgi:hypothetical protein